MARFDVNDSLLTQSILKAQMEDERQRKKEQTRSFFFFFFFLSQQKDPCALRHSGKHWSELPPVPPPPSPLNLQKRIWQSDRTFSFRSDVLFIIFSVFVTTLISPYLLRHGIFGGFKVFFFLTEGKDTNSGACFLLLGGRDFRQVPSLLWRPGFKLLFCS